MSLGCCKASTRRTLPAQEDLAEAVAPPDGTAGTVDLKRFLAFCEAASEPWPLPKSINQLSPRCNTGVPDKTMLQGAKPDRPAIPPKGAPPKGAGDCTAMHAPRSCTTDTSRTSHLHILLHAHLLDHLQPEPRGATTRKQRPYVTPRPPRPNLPSLSLPFPV